MKKPGPKPKLSASRQRRLVHDFLAGDKQEVLALVYGVSRSTVCRTLVRCGIGLERQVMSNSEIEARWGQRFVDLVRQFAEQGLSSRQCARALGVRESRIPAGYHSRRRASGVFVLGGLAVKRCSGCWVTRPLSQFSDDASKSSGIRSRCRICDTKHTS
jgi:hypothetical protein